MTQAQSPRIQAIGIVGCGVMGAGIAQVAATVGFHAVMYDIDPQALGRARHTIIETKFGLKRGVELGKLAPESYDDVLARLSFSTSLKDLASVDLLIEAVPEDLALKQSILWELDQLAKPETIIASNTSGFAIQELGHDMSEKRLALFAGMHFASPVPAMRMCEIIYTPLTSPATIETLQDVAATMGKTVCMVRDTPGTYGFILNRVYAAAKREAQQIVDDGIATPEDVDRAMMTGRNWPVGFFNSQGTKTGWLDE